MPTHSTPPAEVEPRVTQASERRSPVRWAGLFLLNTALVYVFATRVSPMLVGRWFAWFAPALNIPASISSGDWYLSHLEIVAILPALVAGYIDIGRFIPSIVGKRIAEWRSGSAGTYAWVVPTLLLLYKMWRFRPPTSVLVGPSVSAFSYLFDIQKVMPTLANPLASDPKRVLAQMYVTAPFYAGLAYSLGALAWQRRWAGRTTGQH
jgi:hypothetical protein